MEPPNTELYLIISELNSYLARPEFAGILLVLKVLSFILTSFFLLFIIITLYKTSWLRYRFLEEMVEFFTYRPYGVKRVSKAWSKIIERLESPSEGEHKLAVIEADEMLGDILKKMGYPGKDLEERLKRLTSATISNIDQVLEAHKTRDHIVHDPDFRLTRDQAKKLLSIYEQALMDLESL